MHLRDFIKVRSLIKSSFSVSNNIKALEYTALGIPGIYTDIDPYKNLKFTCETDDYMIDTIELFASSVDKRKEAYEHDYKVVEEQLFWEEHDNLRKYMNAYLSLFDKKMRD